MKYISNIDTPAKAMAMEPMAALIMGTETPGEYAFFESMQDLLTWKDANQETAKRLKTWKIIKGSGHEWERLTDHVNFEGIIYNGVDLLGTRLIKDYAFFGTREAAAAWIATQEYEEGEAEILALETK